MIRVVLDTNILVSAILFPEVWLLGFSVMSGGQNRTGFFSDTAKEVFLVLRSPKIKTLLKKRAVSLRKVESFLRTLINSSVRTAGNVEIAAINDDPSDNMFLACALEAEADFIVSDDVHLNKLKSFHGIQIVDTIIFLKVMGRVG